ncbi:GGDEF domain-containing protein [Rhodanobacter sp. AS-Z3]|uniref:tetratricopeptide repeat-containing diguanylate cyclase n=1 Tax=Rhodanobacter sp. AS-Z3 TaxID=3031330 RepID=UPI0024785AFC|nr:GGDEF domain-containing protein [Rhodanobacter sp. AS-Z3]WEN14226.1 GGDEF domain-containing protein [Rhodanobacter sp. AS-Z3]
MTQVVTDLQAHGYQNSHAALTRLRDASDVPGPTSPLDARLHYEQALLKLAMEGNQIEQVRASLTALQRMARQEACDACHFYALLAQARLALVDVSAPAARPYLDQASVLLTKNRNAVDQQIFYTLLGNTQAQDRKLNTGIENTMRALELAEARGDAAAAVRLQGALIWMNADLGDLRRASGLGEDAYDLATAMNFRPAMAQISLDLGHVYALTGDRAKQRTAIERSLSLSRDDPGLISLQVLSLNNLSDLYLSEPGQEQRVLDYAHRADDLASLHKMELQRAAPLTNIGLAQARLGRVADGVANIREAIAISQRHGQKEYVVGITRELVGVLERASRYREALTELRKADALELDLTRQQRDSAVLDLQEKYAAEHQAQKIIQLSAQNALKQAELAAESWRNRLWAALALMLAIGSALLVRSIRQARLANRSLAIANASLAEQSTTDPLTGAANRRHVQNLLQQQPRPLRTRRTDPSETRQPETSLLLLDLDFFKRINDTHGHSAGDLVLVTVAQRLRQLLRQEDTVARWGGEEFVLVLPHTPASTLPAVAHKVLQVIASTPVSLGECEIAVTVSLGAVSFPMYADQGWEAALAVADLALYEAKSAGRNRAVCLTRVNPHADLQQLRGDLAQSEQAGDIDLTEVPGPAVGPTLPQPASTHDKSVV